VPQHAGEAEEGAERHPPIECRPGAGHQRYAVVSPFFPSGRVVSGAGRG
jgi:hypothetical protein